ncbi:FlgD immunoglobulin-like domain containing protein [Baekduia sp. Peel2402]|uniref:FlgD immunoglobulin-like domain containing protein n=1 Tax=Baekduia sp. Peel2402 TaxID=3458296 RepID=UPI00403EE32D
MRRAPVVIFGVLVAATFAAFFVAQRLKNAPTVVQLFRANYTFSPNGDGRYDRSHITFRVKKADDVTVEILDADGDPVRTLMDDKHLDAYRPIDPSLSWDGRDDDGQLLPDGTYRVRITLRHLGRSLIPQRSIVKDTTPPQPKVRSIGPSPAYGPELLPEPDGKPAHIRFLPAGYRAKIMIFKTAPGMPRLVLERKMAKGVTTFDWDGTTDSGARASAGTYLVVLQWRDFPGNIGSSAPLDRKTGLPILDRGKLPGRGGITVRYLGAQTPVTAVKARDTVEIKVDARQARYRWEVRPLGTATVRARSNNPKTTPNVRFEAPGGKSRMYVFTAHTATKSTRVVFPVQARAAVAGTAAKPHGVLVVLPYTTWQGRNPVDDDGDGAPNTLDLGGPARAVRVWAGDGLPQGFADQEANVFRWMDGQGKRYDITTDLALLGGSGPRLTGHTGVLIPGDARWLPTKVRAALRAFVKAGGTVVSTGTDSLRRSVGFDTKTGRFVKPSVRRTTDLFGMRIGALQTKTTDLTNFTNDPKLDLFKGADGVFQDVEAWEPTERTGEEADLLSNAVTDDPDDPKTVVIAARFGKGLVIRPGFPSFARRVAEDSDPATSALMARMWTLLSR